VRTFNIASQKTILGSTLSHKSEAISFSGNPHAHLTRFLASMTSFGAE
jgi:hypothetical protein